METKKNEECSLENGGFNNGLIRKGKEHLQANNEPALKAS